MHDVVFRPFRVPAYHCCCCVNCTSLCGCLGALYSLGLFYAANCKLLNLIQTSLLIPALILQSLTLCTVMDIVTEVLQYYNTKVSFNTIINIMWANLFICCFATMAVFLGVVVIALQRPFVGLVRKNSMDKGFRPCHTNAGTPSAFGCRPSS